MRLAWIAVIDDTHLWLRVQLRVPCVIFMYHKPSSQTLYKLQYDPTQGRFHQLLEPMSVFRPFSEKSNTPLLSQETRRDEKTHGYFDFELLHLSEHIGVSHSLV
jgi:hypothetical protein